MPLGADDLFARLGALDISVETVTHPPLFTVEESRKLRGELPGGHTKNLFLKDKKGKIFLVVACEDTPIDLKRIHTVIGAQGRVSFGKPDLLMDVLGVIPGAVTPFALINDETDKRINLVLDKILFEHDPLNFHPLDNSKTSAIRREDFSTFLTDLGYSPIIAELPKPETY